MERRVISTKMQEEDIKIESSLRPQTLEDYIGQEKIKDNLHVYIEAAKGMPPIGCTVMTPNGLGKVCFIKFLNGVVSVKLEDGKTYDFNRDDIEMVDADVNVDIDIHHNPMAQAYPVDEKVDMRQLKQLEDDRNSSTGNV